MSYDLYVDNENKGQIASNHGWIETAHYMETHGGIQSKALVSAGECENAHALSEEIQSMVHAADPEIASVLKQLARHDSKHAHIGVSQESIDKSDD